MKLSIQLKILSRYIRKPSKLMVVILTAVLLFGGFFIYYTWLSAKNEQANYLLNLAKTAEAGFQEGAVSKLEASPKDLEKPQYEHIKDSLIKIVAINPNIQFAYIFVQKQGKILFVADSEPVGSKNYSPPGQEYTEANRINYLPLKEGREIITDPYKDRWGNWISVLIPMKNIETGKVLAVFGIDYPVKLWKSYIFTHVLQSAIIVFVLLLLVLAFSGLISRNKRILKDKITIEGVTKNFNNFFNTVDDMLFVLDTSGYIIHVNKTVNNKLGYSIKELSGKSILMLHPEDRREEAGKIVAGMISGELNSCPVPVISKQGIEIPVETKVSLGEWNGKPALFGVSKDISEIKKSEEKFSKAFHAGGVLMAISEIEEGIYIEVNNTFLSTLGFSREEVIGKKSKELNIFEDSNQRAIIRKSFEDEGRLQNLEIRIRGKDKVYHTGIFNAEPINIGEKPCWLTTMVDITRRKEVEDELVKMKEVAEAANVAKSQFLARMSHEIRTPLNGILGFLQLLDITGLSETQKDYIKECKNSSELLLSIINDILDFSKIEAGKLNVEKIQFNLRNLVDSIVYAFTPVVQEKGISLYSFIKSEVPEEVIGDPGRLRQILNNLLSNAVKFTKEGEITVYAERLEESEGIVTLRFEVSDTGIGIDEEYRDKLFRPFIQVDDSTTRKYGGTGLGLAISKELANMMQGDISFTSTHGKGTTFLFTGRFGIPISNNKRMGEIHCTISEKMDTSKLKNLRILLVDNNKSNNKIIRHYLEEYETYIEETENGEEAIAKLLENVTKQVPFDLVITNYQMPLLGGYELAAAIKAIPSISSTKLILINSVLLNGQARQAKDACFDAYLTKPVKRQELLGGVLLVMGSKENAAKNDTIITEYIQTESESVKLPKILLVEDNMTNRKLVTVMLKKKGYDCDVAENGYEALNTVINKDYDIVLMDCQMPVMDGYEATGKIREAQGDKKHTTIVAMTADVMNGAKEKCIQAGMDDYISKPINFEELFKTIKRYTQKTEK